MTPPLSDLQLDALTEIFNIGVGQAASSMSQIVDEEISLSVPKIEVIQGSLQAGAIKSAIRSPRICAVSQDFVGGIDAKAFLVFPEGKTREIVRRMLGEAVSTDELGEMEQEALSEIGNIILNSCFSSLADVLHADFRSSLPVYHLGQVDEIMPANSACDDDLMILLHIDFSMPKAKIDGYLVFLMALPSFNELIKQVDRFLSDIG